MATVIQRRKVLVLSGGPYVRNLLALVHELKGQSSVDSQAALAVINRQEFDAIVLELRWPDLKHTHEVQGRAICW